MTQKSSKNRLDTLLVDRGLISSREKARALIMEGKVSVDGMRVDKPGKEISNLAQLEVKEPLEYVSRGGIKLAAALDEFGIDPVGLTALDAGASTGGFTDCLLQRGTQRIIAVDVGYGQFHWKLRNDPRVRLIERTNFRYLEGSTLNESVDAAVADLSFISLKLVLAKFAEILPKGSWFVPLVKPQFEVGRADVGKHGVVRDPDVIGAAIESVIAVAIETGFTVLNQIESPIKGPKGNREFLLHLLLTTKMNF
ncbi:MAG: TlyA family RNA methyltransferase [Deltaproteobacteria bacterium]|nr:TlyA family RNA methyltransferase [Deltaproteobacteria bacterium]